MSLLVPPSPLDIVIYQGATWRLPLRWDYGPDPGDVDPVDLTGASARAQVRVKPSAATVLLELTSAPGDGITLGGAAGTLDLEASAVQTAALPAGQAVWDLEVAWPDGVVCRLVAGAVTIRADVTRD